MHQTEQLLAGQIPRALTPCYWWHGSKFSALAAKMIWTTLQICMSSIWFTFLQKLLADSSTLWTDMDCFWHFHVVLLCGRKSVPSSEGTQVLPTRFTIHTISVVSPWSRRYTFCAIKNWNALRFSAKARANTWPTPYFGVANRMKTSLDEAASCLGNAIPGCCANGW